MKHKIVKLLLLFLSIVYASWGTTDNKGGKLKVVDIKAWQCDSLIYDGGSFKTGPIIGTITPKPGKCFIVVSAQIDIDWAGFPNATQYFLDIREIKLGSQKAEYQPFGSYREGGRYSENLSTHLYPLRDADSPYYLDVVFCIPSEEVQKLTFCTTETSTAVTLQNTESTFDKLPALFEITDAKRIDQLPPVKELFGYFERQAKDDFDFTLEPLWGRFLSLTIKVTANDEAFYGYNQEGLYTKDHIIILAHEIGILSPDQGYFPAVAMLSGDAVKTLSSPYRDKENPVFIYTLIFCVPKDISTFDLFYKKQPVVKQFSLK